MRTKHYVLLLAFLSLSACQNPNPKEIVTTTLLHSKRSQEPYLKSLKKVERSTTVFSNYETLYMFSAAIMSSDFYDAFKRRVQEQFQTSNVVQEVTKNATVFVSIYSPNFELNDLSNKRLWEFQLDVNGVTYVSKSVKPIKEKEGWFPFFPFINQWTSDFIVNFDIPSTAEIPIGSKFIMTMSNAQAKTLLEW